MRKRTELNKIQIPEWIRKIFKYFEKEMGICEEAVILCVIKALYIILTVAILSGQWYGGYGSYGIDFNPIKEIFSSIMFGVTLFIYLKRKVSNYFLKVVLQFLVVLYYIPLNSAFSIHNTSITFGVLSNLYYMLLVLLLTSKFLERILGYFFAEKECNCTHQYSKQLNTLLWFCFIITIIYITFKISYNGIEFLTSMQGSDVYKIRASFQEYMDSISGTPWAYFLTIIQNLCVYVFPIYILISLEKKRYIHLLIAVLGVVAEYSVSSSKSSVFFALLIPIVYLSNKLKLLTKVKKLFYSGILAMMVWCLGELIFSQSKAVYMLFVRREFFFPSWLDTLYFDYFSTHPKVHWSQSVLVLQNIIESSYTEQPVNIISKTYFKGEVPSPNSGMFAEAYMHFGIIGIIIYPILLCMMLKISAKIYNGYGYSIMIVIAAKVVLHMINVPVLRTDFVLSYILFTFVVGLVGKYFRSNMKCRRKFDGKNKS